MTARWTPEDAKLLQQLRQLSGLDRASFARQHTLSALQLAELEEGGNGRFYTEAIKAHAGHNILRRLGHEPVPVPQVEQPLPSVEAQAVPVPSPMPAAAPADASVASPQARAHSVKRGRRRLPLLGGVAVAALAGVAFSYQAGRSQFPNPLAQSPQPRLAPATPAEPAEQAASAASLALPAEAAASATAPAAEPAAATQVAAATPSCSPPPGEAPVQYKSPVSNRPSSYIHLEAIKDVSFCVVDSQKRQTVTTLKSGESTTVMGAPPFLVTTAQWNDLRVFFQGLRVSVDPGTRVQAVNLNAL